MILLLTSQTFAAGSHVGEPFTEMLGTLGLVTITPTLNPVNVAGYDSIKTDNPTILHFGVHGNVDRHFNLLARVKE
jgi:hypothetical protein